MIRARIHRTPTGWRVQVIDATDCITWQDTLPTHAEAVTVADTETHRPLEAP